MLLFTSLKFILCNGRIHAHMCLFFLFGSCYHIYRLTHPHILVPNKPCMLMMFRSQFCILSILTSTCTLSILYMLVITPSIFFLKEIEHPKLLSHSNKLVLMTFTRQTRCAHFHNTFQIAIYSLLHFHMFTKH